MFFFKQKTAYEMRISDWSSDVCSSDLLGYEIIRLGGCGQAELVAEAGAAAAFHRKPQNGGSRLACGDFRHPGGRGRGQPNGSDCFAHGAEIGAADADRHGGSPNRVCPTRNLPDSRSLPVHRRPAERRGGKKWGSTGRTWGGT